MTACTGSRMPSLASRLPTCFLTVASLTNSAAAISALLRPRASSSSTSRSRPVSAASRDGAGEVWAGRRANASISLRVTDGADVVDEIAHRVCRARTRLGEFLLADARDKLSQALRSRRQIQRGRRLGCWCVPEPCHAEVIAELADSGALDSAVRQAAPAPQPAASAPPGSS